MILYRLLTYSNQEIIYWHEGQKTPMDPNEPKHTLTLSNAAKVRGLERASMFFRIVAWLTLLHYLIQLVSMFSRREENLFNSVLDSLASAVLLIITLWAFALLLKTAAILLLELDDIRESLSQQARTVQTLTRILETQPHSAVKSDKYSSTEPRL